MGKAGDQEAMNRRSVIRRELHCESCGDTFVHYQTASVVCKKQFCDYCLRKRANKRRLERVKNAA